MKLELTRPAYFYSFRQSALNYWAELTHVLNLMQRMTPAPMDRTDIYPVAVNQRGLPPSSTPAGLIGQRPAGLQIFGNYFDEARLLNVPHQYQKVTGWHARVPQGFE